MESIPIENFLKGIHLSDYLSDLKKRGYDIVDDLLLAEDTEITELASSLKQSKGDTIMGSITPHKRRFISKINEMRKIASSSESSEDNNDSNNNSKNSMSGVGKTSQFKRPGSPRNNHVAPEVLTLYETLEALMDLGVFPTKRNRIVYWVFKKQRCWTNWIFSARNYKIIEYCSSRCGSLSF